MMQTPRRKKVVVYFYDYGGCYKHHGDYCEDCPFDAKYREVKYSTEDMGFTLKTGTWGSGQPAFHLVPLEEPQHDAA